MTFLKVFGVGLLLFAGLIALLLRDEADPNGTAFVIVFGVLFYLPVLFVVALVFQIKKTH
ncbi:hypothetical protein [Rossellomorea aquimaris]|uniref:Transmembrane protein n=1 Tax=Rossellomorea aquimaris TaxID=189382 RepID=A0A1J6WK24_9BACI|nr:hypothetical protein [Rossellomorea aquimaris]OIU68603.1 hypothetical protein BHE18_16905 [Rossellomorea aquimaris]